MFMLCSVWFLKFETYMLGETFAGSNYTNDAGCSNNVMYALCTLSLHQIISLSVICDATETW